MSDSQALPNDDWQQLSPWSIVYFVTRTFKQTLDPNILIMGAPLYGAYQFFENRLLFLYVIGALLVLGVITHAAVSYLFFRYQLEKDKLLIRKGMLFKSRLDIPYERIQDVHIHKPVYFKPFNLVSATIDTAGSNQQEVVLAAIHYSQAASLKDLIVHQTKTSTPSVEMTTATSSKDLILSRSPKDLLIHGISNNKAWFMLALLIPVLERSFNNLANTLLNSNGGFLVALANSSNLALGLIISGAIFIIIIIMMLLSVAGSFISLYDFRLTRGAGTLSRESGLLNRHQVNLKHRRLQYIAVQQGLLDRLFGRYNIHCKQVSEHTDPTQRQRQSFLVPSVKADQTRVIFKEVYPALNLNLASIDTHIQPISRRYILRQILRITLPTTLLIGSFIYLENNLQALLLYVPFIFVMGCGLHYLQWRQWGYYQLDEHLVIRKGLLGKAYNVFPQHKTQQTTIKQSLLMKHNRHCNLELVIGTTQMTIPYIQLLQGKRLADQVLFQLEATGRSWM